MTSSDVELMEMGVGGEGCHLWDEQQAQSDGHGQVSVSKDQHEHPVGVEAWNQGEPAERPAERDQQR